MSDDMTRKVLHFLYGMERKTDIALINAQDRRAKNPSCCQLCEEIANLERKKEILKYLIEEELKKIG